MTDRAALADRLKALANNLEVLAKHINVGDNNNRIATLVCRDLSLILAALREPGFTARASDASVIDKYADLQAVLDDAHKRGAEAMREKAIHWHNVRYADTPDAFEMEFHDVSRKAIRTLPLPEPKP